MYAPAKIVAGLARVQERWQFARSLATSATPLFSLAPLAGITACQNNCVSGVASDFSSLKISNDHAASPAIDDDKVQYFRASVHASFEKPRNAGTKEKYWSLLTSPNLRIQVVETLSLIHI